MSEVNPIDKIFNHFEDRKNRQTIPSCSHLHRASPVQEIHETICFSGSLMPQNRTNKNIIFYQYNISYIQIMPNSMLLFSRTNNDGSRENMISI